MMLSAEKKILTLLFILAFLRGALYAFVLPPWGLLDEEQHFDYILKLTQTGTPPLVGKDYLDREVLQSVLDTNRHQKFHWPVPGSLNPRKWGLEGQSYEGYQGPVYYYLLVPFFLLMDRAVLDKLFGLRILMVAFSLVTVWAATRLTKELFPGKKLLPYLVAAILICIPERTASTARISNDLFLEMISIIFLWVFSHTMLKGITWKSAVSLGLVAGVGLLTKFSFAGMLALLPITFILNIRDSKIVLKGLVACSVTTLISGPFLFYSYVLYADPTGFKGFSDVYQRFAPPMNPAHQLADYFMAVWEVFRGFWVMWWKGSEAISTPWLNGFWIVLFAITILAVVGFIQELKSIFPSDQRRGWILISFVGAIIIFFILVLVGYFGGKFPEIQGRFVLPVDYAFILILTLGLSRFRWSKPLFVLLITGLLIADAQSLLDNTLLNFYYYASFYTNGVPTGYVWQGWEWATRLVISNFIADKPFWVTWCLFLVAPAYIFLLVGLLATFIHGLASRRFDTLEL